jgi:hypothetical protein
MAARRVGFAYPRAIPVPECRNRDQRGYDRTVNVTPYVGWTFCRVRCMTDAKGR